MMRRVILNPFFERRLSEVQLNNYKHNGIFKYDIAE